MEKRLLLAFVLSAVIFAGWSVLFPPERPSRVEPPAEIAVNTAVATSTALPVVDGAIETASEGGEDSTEPRAPNAVEAAAEQRHRLTNDVLEIELSNHGAALTSIVLKEFRGDEGQPLDLIQTIDHPRRTFPLQLVTGEGPDQRLYAVELIDDGYEYRWSDGVNSVTKTVRLPKRGYGIKVTVTAHGQMAQALVSVGSGMRDRGPRERENRFSTWGDVILDAAGELERFGREKVKETELIDTRVTRFVGFEDTYFTSLLRPSVRVASVRIDPLDYEVVGTDGELVVERALQIGVGLDGGRLEGELFSAPKEYNLLRAVDQGVEELLDFGFFHPISVVFLKALHWIYAIVGNYGLAIILLTLAIRIVLFPLMHTSTVSMRKMQKLQPKVKSIQEKYKKNKKDPQVRAKMNQEMMALYKVEGVNPMGGCLPMLVQLPILWALYTLFAHAIELRHAPFIFWIQDLSAKDPYYITPVLMTATMWLQQRLAPQAGDPQQQKIFRMMPLIFGVMFLGFPSGLVLYWLANNVITIAQQEITLHLIGERKRPKKASGKGKGRPA